MTANNTQPSTSTPILYVDYDDGYAEVSYRIEPGTLALLSLPCPGRRVGAGGGIGGQAITPCSFCGEVMASTAGPHSTEGRYFKPVVVTHYGNVGRERYVDWRPFSDRDGKDFTND